MPAPYNPHPLHSTKEIRGHPLFQGAISRWIWRIVTHRITRPGGWFLGMTFAFTVYGATSLDLQVFVPFTYAAGLWIVALVLALTRPPRINLTAQMATRIEAGQTLPVEIDVRALRPLFDATLLPRRLPSAIDAVPLDGVPLDTLRAGETQRVRLGLFCARRGAYVLRGFRVQTAFPCGLLRAFAAVPDEYPLLVLPQFSRLTQMTLPLRRSDQPGGAALSSARREALEFLGDREWRDGDSIRDIDWRATARLDRLVVREFREEYFHRVALLLDTQARAGRETAAFEAAVSLCASAADFAAHAGYALEMLAVGSAVHNLSGEQNLATAGRVLDILATVMPTSRGGAVSAAPNISDGLGRVSVTICVLLDWDNERRALADSLQREGTALKIIIVRDGPCTLDPADDEARYGGITCVSPAQVEAGIEQL